MLSILATGALIADPVERQSNTGKTYATATLRVPTGEDAILVSVIAFDEAAVAQLLRLHKGDAAAVAGTAGLRQWTGRDGAAHHGLGVTAHGVLTVYESRRRRVREAEDRAGAARPQS